MNMISSTLTSVLAADPASSLRPPAKRLDDAAKQFESLMIAQMMKSARDTSGGGWLSDGEETGEDTSISMAEQQFAQTMANNGGLGLAKMIVHTMSNTPKAESPAVGVIGK